MPISWQLDEQNVCPYNGILFIHKKEWSTGTSHNLYENEHIMLSKRSMSQKTIYDFIYIKCLE